MKTNFFNKLEEMRNSKKVSDFVKNVGDAASNAVVKTRGIADDATKTIVTAIDANGNGEIDIEDIIIIGLRTPGVRINRSDFLRKEFFKNYPQDVIDNAITHNPAHAKIPTEEIDRIADEVIKFERNCVSGISAALSSPGGVAMVATIPADITQYYGYMLRATQKLLYLYGFPEIDTAEKGHKFDSETMNILIICLGVMYGVAGANNALKGIARALAAGVEKKLLNAALTKGAIYPVVKSVAKWFGVKMTKEIFSGFFKKAIPLAGGVIGGGITYITFKSCCDRLKDSIQNTNLSNPNYQAIDADAIIIAEESE